MSSTEQIILDYVCPSLGLLIGNFMFSAPFRDLKIAIERGHLGDLNPTPWAFMFGNCFGWVIYSILQRDLWLFFGNCPALILSVWLNLGASKLQYQGHHSKEMRKLFANYLQETQKKSQSRPETNDEKDAQQFAKFVWDMTARITPAKAPHETLVMGIVILWTAVASIIAFGQNSLSEDTQRLIIGLIVNANLVFFYGAPLTTIWIVLKTQNSSSIHRLTMMLNTFNGCFWGAYGIARSDPFIYVPNFLGVVLGVIQILLTAVFPNRNGREQSETIVEKKTSNEVDEKDEIQSESSVQDLDVSC